LTTENGEVIDAKYESLDFDFNKFLNSSTMGTSILNNPVWANSILKTVTSSPQKYNRTKLKIYLQNPVYHEKELKDFGQYLYNSNMFFKRLVHYFGDLLDFRYIIIPQNPDNSVQFKKAYNKILDWYNKFNVVYEFRNMMHTIILEDVAFYSIRENDDIITLQRLPTDYCKIVGKTNLGYKFAINMSFFLQSGIDVNSYCEEIQDAYWKYISGKGNIEYFHVTLDPTKSVCFKWDESFAGIMPALLGIYLNSLDIVEYQDIQKAKTELETWKMVLQKIPMRNDKDSKRNDFLIDEGTAGAFHTNVKSALPEGASVITSPMDISAINFDNSPNSEDIVGYSTQQFWDASGVSPMLFGAQSKSSVGVQNGVKIDEAFVTLMYQQCARFCNYHSNVNSKKYKFFTDFLNSTILNKKEQFDSAVQGLQYGMPVSLMGHALGLRAGDLDKLNLLEKYTGLKDNLEPVQTSHSSNLEDKKGKPESDLNDLTDSGMQTREQEQNKEEL